MAPNPKALDHTSRAALAPPEWRNTVKTSIVLDAPLGKGVAHILGETSNVAFARRMARENRSMPRAIGDQAGSAAVTTSAMAKTAGDLTQ
jgi:hypothetical protein